MTLAAWPAFGIDTRRACLERAAPWIPPGPQTPEKVLFRLHWRNQPLILAVIADFVTVPISGFAVAHPLKTRLDLFLNVIRQ